MRGPRPAAVGLSLALHALGVLLVLVLPARRAGDAGDPRRIDVVFYSPPAEEPPPVAREVARPREPVPREEPPAPVPPPPEPPPSELPPPTPPPPRVEPAPSLARVAPPREPVAAPVPPRAVRRALPPAPEPRVAQAAPREAPGPVVTGAFAATEAAPAPSRRSAGAVERVAAFGAGAVSPAPAPREDRAVARSGFADGVVVAAWDKQAAPRGSVTRTAFDATTEAEADRRQATEAVQRGSFGDGATAAPRSRPRERPVASLDSGVEVLSKAAPVYTAEARRLRVEGAVVLDVIFLADGRLRILGVAQGLGHGLDEAAVEAARRIRFKPARRGGRPVDHTATLRVVFRLA